LSSLAEQGWIHSVPVHFLHRDGQIRICCRTSSVKALNVGRSRRGTLCVEVTNGPERRYVTVEGPARVERPAIAHDLAALDEKYSRTDTAGWAGADYAGEAAIVITPAADRLVRLGLKAARPGYRLGIPIGSVVRRRPQPAAHFRTPSPPHRGRPRLPAASRTYPQRAERRSGQLVSGR
jgi:hypothetical protein